MFKQIMSKQKLTLATCLLALSPAVFADSEKSALVIQIEEDVCGFATPTTFSLGSVQAVFNAGGRWLLSCKGNVVDGELPKRAIVGISSEDDPLGPCIAFGGLSTLDWTITVTPSGKSSFTCQGVFDSPE